MDISDLKTEVAIIKKQLYGNGVKGLIEKVEDFEEFKDKFSRLEIYMEKTLMEAMQGIRKEIIEKNRFNKQNMITLIGFLLFATLEVINMF